MTGHSYPYSVALFFTRGVSLHSWYQAGLFEREVALYRRLQSNGVKVTFITYGDSADLQYEGLLPGITICCNRFGIPDWLYARLINQLHRKHLLAADLIKTNQTIGADVALLAAVRLRKPLISRCGYLLSEFAACQFGADSRQAVQARELEDKVFGSADAIVVTTPAMKDSVLNRQKNAGTKIEVIPNYVDMTIFSPTDKLLDTLLPRLCFVGRLEPQKNIEALIEAVNGTDTYLDIIGQGEMADALANAAVGNTRISFHGPIPNKSLPQYILRSSAFILPSLYEGHPKVLIEAMACGVPVIGADVPGINAVIRHGENGWLCRTDASSIREAIQTVLSDTALQQRLGSNAHRYVMEHYDLDKVVEMELDVYRRILGKDHT